VTIILKKNAKKTIIVRRREYYKNERWNIFKILGDRNKSLFEEMDKTNF